MQASELHGLMKLARITAVRMSIPFDDDIESLANWIAFKVHSSYCVGHKMTKRNYAIMCFRRAYKQEQKKRLRRFTVCVVDPAQLDRLESEDKGIDDVTEDKTVMRRMTDRQRDVVTLRFDRHMTYQQIASRLRLSVAQVRYTLSQCADVVRGCHE